MNLSFFNNKILKYFLSIFIFLVSCDSESFKKNSKTLELDFSIDKYNENAFINMVNDIEIDDKKFYFLDSNISTVFVLDSNFTYLTNFGKRGKGPGEFLSCAGLSVNKKYVYVSDFLGNCIFIFNKFNFSFENKILLPKELHINPYSLGFDENENCYCNSLEKNGYYIGYFNLKDNSKVNYLGKIPPDSKKVPFRNIFYWKNDLIIAVPLYESKIYLFNKLDPEYFNTIEIPFPKNVILKWQEKVVISNNHTPFFVDSYFSDKLLYLSFQNFELSCRTIAKIEFKNLRILSIEYLHLKEKNGDDVFCIDNNRIITFAYLPMAIQVYENR